MPPAALTVRVNGVDYVLTVDDALQLDASGAWRLTIATPQALSEGSYDVTATSTDSAGNSSVDTTSAELIIDQTAP